MGEKNKTPHHWKQSSCVLVLCLFFFFPPKVTQHLGPFTLWLISAVKNIQSTLIFTPSVLRFPWKPFIFIYLFLCYLSLQRAHEGKSLHFNHSHFARLTLTLRAHLGVITLTHFSATAQSFYLPTEQVNEQLLSLLDYRCCVSTSSSF